MKHLVVGGARSGKSRHAEALATASGLEVVYIATARAEDDEMSERVAQHRASRPAHWTVIEEPVELAAALAGASATTRCVIVDCLTVWLANLCACPVESRVAAVEALYTTLPTLAGQTILVSNEVGLGIVPQNALARAFRDATGLLHQRLARLCDVVELVVAGIPVHLCERSSAEDAVLEISMCDPGGSFQRIQLDVSAGLPPVTTLPRAIRDRLSEEGLDLPAVCRLPKGPGEREMLNLESERGTLRIGFRARLEAGRGVDLCDAD